MIPLKLCNAFALSMLPGFPGVSRAWTVKVEAISLEHARVLLADGFESFVGHEETAALLSSLLGRNVPCVRKNLTLAAGEILIVAQYAGPRLPPGTTILPTGAGFTWLRVRCEISLG